MEKSYSQKLLLGIQHVLAMFGATVLVPMLTGLNSSIALICAGVGTFIFHSVTKRKVPVFLGSSFAFIAALQAVIVIDPATSLPTLDSLSKVKGALIVAGLIYVLFALLIKLVGYEKVTKILPGVVTGPMIIVIGLRLSSSAVSDAFYKTVKNADGSSASVFDIKYAIIAIIVILTIVLISVYTKGIINLMPILVALTVGYIASLIFDYAFHTNLVSFDTIKNASFISFTNKDILDQLTTIPRFDVSAILAIAPISIVTIIEHVGDITTNGAVVGQNFIADPGVHRTLLGDGLATAFAGIMGGPANTTYGENTGVLAVTKNYDPSILRIAAGFAIVLGIFGKVGGFINSIPSPVRGGISIVLFGMIASVGVRILISNQIDMSKSRNLMISSLIFVLGIGISSVPVTDTVEISGLAIAAFVGIVLNLVLVDNSDSSEN
ncbi:uracil permease [Lachnospiraceae bacterium KM106-2]|nr:uracil permease [Lachnospiraceae bacterium KM106-2]